MSPAIPPTVFPDHAATPPESRAPRRIPPHLLWAHAFADQSNGLNYESARSWDIYPHAIVGEMLKVLAAFPARHLFLSKSMGNETQMDDLHTRMLRVTEDLRVIQRELNCAAMQAPNDPELMEALSALPETEAIQVLCKSLDQMRHFLWFYIQVMSNDPELGDKLRQAKTAPENGELDTSFLDKLTRADEAVLLRYLADAKDRKPN
jgi:hypothetical protein